MQPAQSQSARRSFYLSLMTPPEVGPSECKDESSAIPAPKSKHTAESAVTHCKKPQKGKIGVEEKAVPNGSPKSKDTTGKIGSPAEEKVAKKRTKEPSTPKKRAKKELMTAELRVPSNWQRKPHVSDRTGPMNFEGASISDDASELSLQDGSKLVAGDHVYLLSEPIGEPYFIGRIMEFVQLEKGSGDKKTVADNWVANINWLYRPHDLPRKANNTRELYLTMHSDQCPLQSFRGRCTVKYIKDISDLGHYMETPSQFWFQSLWDKYISRSFDVVSTSAVQNIPISILPALRQRFDFVVCEPAQTKELLRSARSCKTCGEFATASKAIECLRCGESFHMSCLDPPLTKKPSLGFAWSCAPCNFEHTTGTSIGLEGHSSSGSSGESTEDDEAGSATVVKKPQQAQLPELSPAEQRLKRLWPFRYLGMHTQFDEEICDADARIQPRAASRVGPKNQAQVAPWPGRPVIYYRPVPTIKRKGRGIKGRAADLEVAPRADCPDKSLPWVQEMPAGYIERGGESTSTLLWSQDVAQVADEQCKQFLAKAEPYAAHLQMKPSSSNFLDACLTALMNSRGAETQALEEIAGLSRKTLKEPSLSREEIRKFEEGIEIHGDDLKFVTRHVKTASSADIVRFYYLWRKTDAGRRIWDDNPNRASRRRGQVEEKADAEFALAIMDEQEPMTGYSAEKVKALKKSLICVHCRATNSRDWRKLAGHPPIAAEPCVEALCIRCARLWYRYAVTWMPPEEVSKLQALKGSQKVQIEPELEEDSRAIMTERAKYTATGRKRPTQTRKKKKEGDEPLSAVKAETNNTNEHNASGEEEKASKASAVEVQKEISPEPPEDRMEAAIRRLTSGEQLDEPASLTASSAGYCVVCTSLDPNMKQLHCDSCGLNVHAACYGWPENTKAGLDWRCDNCVNDVTPAYDTNYNCMLCPVNPSSHIAWLGGSTENRRIPDALKRADKSNWAHIRCAVWSKGVGFTDPEALEVIMTGSKFEPVCPAGVRQSSPQNELCSLCNYEGGSLVGCCCCTAKYHASCAANAGVEFGFTIKKSDSDTGIVWNGSQVTIDANLRCNGHTQSANIRGKEDSDQPAEVGTTQSGDLTPMSEIDLSSGLTALQTFVRSHCLTDDSGIWPSTIIANRQSVIHKIMCSTDISITTPVIIPSDPNLWVPTDLFAKPPAKLRCGVCATNQSTRWYKTDAHLKCAKCNWGIKKMKIEPLGQEWLVECTPRLLDASFQAKQLIQKFNSLSQPDVLRGIGHLLNTRDTTANSQQLQASAQPPADITLVTPSQTHPQTEQPAPVYQAFIPTVLNHSQTADASFVPQALVSQPGAVQPYSAHPTYSSQGSLDLPSAQIFSSQPQAPPSLPPVGPTQQEITQRPLSTTESALPNTRNQLQQ